MNAMSFILKNGDRKWHRFLQTSKKKSGKSDCCCRLGDFVATKSNRTRWLNGRQTI